MRLEVIVKHNHLINLIISNLEVHNKIMRMANITIIKIFIKIIKIHPNQVNIEDIHALMDGKIKSIVRMWWIKYLSNIKDKDLNMELSKICIKIIMKILDNIPMSWKEGSKQLEKHTKLNKWENNDNGKPINKNKWENLKKK